MMRSLLIYSILLISVMMSATASGQATMTTSGNWNVAGNWSGSNIGDLLAENVTINNSVNPTIPNGNSYTVGNVTLIQDNNFTIDNTGVLSVGSSGNARNFTTNLNPNLVINGNLEIWGDLIANDNIVFNITGTVRIHGNIIFSSSGTTVTVNGTGNLIVDGNMTGGNNINFNVNGSVAVAGNVSVGNGSNLSGSGTFSIGGTCSGGGSPFCSSGILPVNLLYFKAKVQGVQVSLTWETGAEDAVDYFMVERSADGESFQRIASVLPVGNPHQGAIYSLMDEKPFIGSGYYRLREMTLNGELKTLSIIRLGFEGNRNLLLYPNPVNQQEQVSISLNFAPESNYEASIFDMTGRVVGRWSDNRQEMTVPYDLAAGIYIVRIASSEFNAQQRLIVR